MSASAAAGGKYMIPGRRPICDEASPPQLLREIVNGPLRQIQAHDVAAG
eukprot:CAMPEP_0168480316 /NCGR_PEP_ID=MMETSP0228-20121227/63931_1 /TAXON_ID=133427 /ORGANISM="Protoceratium reticulatum, Strain CCCM 535 (=CCMP 1889)" /LENGTH=48 /DNA_ID= /DNA_START= /DNA_END= /DNA_ORIENTATION=